MSIKRSRSTYEADLQAQQSPFVFFGTPLPPVDPEIRDDGSYVPIWKQEVRDDRGRKRLHGAFTGGWSAGYFNTVGSKEGWAPSTFVSSRTNRRKDEVKTSQQRPEDFMDEEDLADAEESRKIQTSEGFAGLGLTEDDSSRPTGLAGLLRAEGGTMGVKLLQKMGWKQGQGIGPKVRRNARLEMGDAGQTKTTYLFAPDDVAMISFVRKTDRKGLFYKGSAKLTAPDFSSKEDKAGQSDEEDEQSLRPSSILLGARNFKAKKAKGGFGLGVLNDTGSDDEDPYEVGPRISYNRVLGGDKKKKKKIGKEDTAANPSVRVKPTFVARKVGRTTAEPRRGHDGRPPLAGFVLSRGADKQVSDITSEGKYPPPQIPPGWKSSKKLSESAQRTDYISAADAARGSNLNPQSRAAMLGEKQLPGKSVFDFLSAEARERVATATGRTDLPQARGEVPEGYALSDAERMQQLLNDIPRLEKDTAIAAIARGANGSGPYRDDEAKQSRYRSYLEHSAGFGVPLPVKPLKMREEDWLREYHEFYNCARIFKPMTGFMASRFTTGTAKPAARTGNDGTAANADLLAKPAPRPPDPAEEAAKMDMFGQMTRSVQDFFPSRLLCKRFNVKPPAHVQPDGMEEDTTHSKSGTTSHGAYPVFHEYGPARTTLAIEQAPAQDGRAFKPAPLSSEAAEEDVATKAESNEAVVDACHNPALEGKRAGDEVFKAIFGDSSDDDGDSDEE